MFSLGSFSLLMAPPAWGKTRLFRQWVGEIPRPFLYISPLRALANEVVGALGDHPGLCQTNGKLTRDAWQRWAREAPYARILVVTPEQLPEGIWEELATIVPEAVIVWDEVHLVSLWGESFRSKLLEQWWGYSASGLAGVGLSATVDASLREFLQESLAGLDCDWLEGDAGNFGFKQKPRYRFLPLSWMPTLLQDQLPDSSGNTLLFCPYRQQVDHWVRLLREQGLSVVGCKGGETADFQMRLTEVSFPVVIVATSCLSHGVNLPSLERVVLLYRETHPAMLHQMLTRGGRKGEAYEVWCPWKPLHWRHWFDWPRGFYQLGLAQAWGFMGEWWHGAGRTRHSNHSPKRT